MKQNTERADRRKEESLPAGPREKAHENIAGNLSESGNSIRSDRRALAEAVADYLDAHFFDPELSLSKLGGIFHFNENYISYTFKEYMGTGIKKYLERKRMHKACVLLEHGNRPVKEIAAESGYTDALYFERVFKRFTGLTPTEYRHKPHKKPLNGLLDPFTQSFYR